MFVHDELNKVCPRAHRWEECEGSLVIWVFAHFSSSIYLEDHSRDVAAEYVLRMLIQCLHRQQLSDWICFTSAWALSPPRQAERKYC